MKELNNIDIKVLVKLYNLMLDSEKIQGLKIKEFSSKIFNKELKDIEKFKTNFFTSKGKEKEPFSYYTFNQETNTLELYTTDTVIECLLSKHFSFIKSIDYLREILFYFKIIVNNKRR